MTRPTPVREPLPDVVADAATNRGNSIGEVSSEGDGALLVFLRHAGCPFCREAAADLRRQREAIEGAGYTIVLVHQGTEEAGERFFTNYRLGDVHRVADPERTLFHAMHIRRGNLWQILGPKVMVRSVLAALKGHLPGKSEGDPFQMPGTFLVKDRVVVMAYRHTSQADRPAYGSIACTI